MRLIARKGWYANQRVTTYYPYELRLLYDLRVTFCVEVTNYCLLYELRVTFYIQVTTYCLLHDWRFTFIARVTNYFLHSSYELLFIAQVTDYFYYTSYELFVTYGLRVTMSYDKDEDDKAVTIIKLQWE